MSNYVHTFPNGNDPLDKALASPLPQSIRLIAELVDPAKKNRPLLITSPVKGPWIATVGGDLASAASDMGYSKTQVLDLRGVRHHSQQPSRAQDSQDHSYPGQSLQRKIQVLTPPEDLVNQGSQFRNWVQDIADRSDPLLLICGGTLDPEHWLEDPLSWSFLEPTILVASGLGQHTSEQLGQTGERLRRAGLDLAGSVSVAPSRSFSFINYLRWFQDICPSGFLFNRKVEA